MERQPKSSFHLKFREWQGLAAGLKELIVDQPLDEKSKVSGRVFYKVCDKMSFFYKNNAISSIGIYLSTIINYTKPRLYLYKNKNFIQKTMFRTFVLHLAGI